jgi:hypothetical protein
MSRRRDRTKRRRIRFLSFFFVILLLAVSVYMLSTFLRVLLPGFRSDEDLASVRVEVLNGCGVPKLATKVSWELRKLGFDVVRVGDAHQSDFKETMVVERRAEDRSNAIKLATRIGCARLMKEIDPTLYLEVTLILGTDYHRYFPQIELESE